jgi:hypothetical protein
MRPIATQGRSYRDRIKLKTAHLTENQKPNNFKTLANAMDSR